MFAYACETYSCIVELGNTMTARRRLFEDIENEQMPPDGSFDAKDYIQALRDAIDTRNGWKRILHSCIPPARRGSGSGEGRND
jgi:hypothetical protein